MKHTPTPPTLVLMERGAYTDFEGDSQVIMSDPLTSEDAMRVAVVHVHDGDSEATAKKLVSAYNVHDALINALKRCKKEIDAIWRDGDQSHLGYVLLEVNEALAKSSEATK